MTLLENIKNFFSGSDKHNSTTHATEGLSNFTTEKYSSNNLPNNEFTVESEAGAIAGLIFGLLIAIGMIVLALVMIKKKRDNDRQYQKRLRIQRSTKQNAGVYMDTTMTEDLVTTDKSSLRQKDLYEEDSEDEI